MRVLYGTVFLIAFFLSACGPTDADDGRGGPGTGDEGEEVQNDEDGDGIGDDDEGRTADLDTDGDGTPDYLDDDSDGDGLPDALEGGDDKASTPPVDSDFDGTPDFQDLDADGNGLSDGQGTESTDDLDGDGIGNWSDVDDDGDGIDDKHEIGDAAGPPDSDGDGIVDMHDLDSDNDTIGDADELLLDPDQDLMPAFVDDDADGDCRIDADEAGDGDVASPPFDNDKDGLANFLDLDSDNDGISDQAEDANCNGVTDSGETAADDEDTDNDGATDLVEGAAGTDPTDDGDNPAANGDFVFLVPYENPPSPVDDDLDFSTDLQKVDVYVLMDLSGSMAGELTSIKDNMQTVLSNLTCPPAGTGDPATCIPEVWSGLGSFTYAGRNPYINELSLQPNPAKFSTQVPAADNGLCPTGGCNEPHDLALWMTATGQPSLASGCNLPDDLKVPGKPSCTGQPAGQGGVGYPCFRKGALPVVLLATDEAPSATSTCPTQSSAISELNAIGAKVVGIHGSGGTMTTVISDLEDFASGTGAVDAQGPLVFDGSDAAAASAIEDAVKTVANNVPLDIAALTADDPSDSVNAISAFVDRLETLQLGNAACSDGLTDEDESGDGVPDAYVDVIPGTPVCWKLVAKKNQTVPATGEPQLFKATVNVIGDDVTDLDSRDVYFLVPPKIAGGGID